MLINHTDVLYSDEIGQLFQGKTDMRLVGYVRVSTDAQRDNTSRDEQKRAIKAYCDTYKHKLVRIFEEVGSGGRMDNRPAFQQAVESLDNVDGFISYRLDRVARNTYDVLHLVNHVLKPKQKELILVMDQVDTTTPNGRFFLTIMAAMGELEKETISHRMQTGRKAKAEKGGYAFGSPPYGWTSINGVLVQVEEEQVVIETIRRHRRGGKSFNAIAKLLNEQGIPTKQGQKNPGRKWYAAQVRDVLERIRKAG